MAIQKLIEAPHKLHPEQGYVLDTARALGIDARLVGHGTETRTCHEKAQVLGWSADRVIKAIYFNMYHEKDDREYFVGVVTPETGSRVDSLSLAPYLFKPLPAGRFYTDSRIPKDMSNGTCTPFPRASLVGSEGPKGTINKLFVFDMPHLDDKLVDISIGGGTPHARRTSMHLPYGAIYGILSSQFPGMVEKVEPKYSA